MVRHLARNVSGWVAIAAVLLITFEASHHRLTVLPADSSPVPVLAGAVLFGAGMTAVEESVRRHLR